MRLLVILSPTDKWGTKEEYTKFRKYLNDPPEVVHRSTKNMIKNTRRGLYYITPEFQEEICRASFRELSPRFRQPLLFHSTSI